MSRLCFLFLFLFAGLQIQAQVSGAIYGHVTDAAEHSEPLIFAEVGLKNTSISTQTNFHGNFELSDIEYGDYILTINYAGYESIEIPVTVDRNSRIYIDKAMYPRTPDNLALEISDSESQSVSEAYPASDR